MSGRKTGGGRETVYAAATTWVDRALRSDDSLFTVGEPIWSRQWLSELRGRCLDRPGEWNGQSKHPFFASLERLLTGSPAEVYQLMGEVLYASYLIAWQAATGTWKREAIEQVLRWSHLPLAMPDDCVDGLRPGLVSANRHFSQNPGLPACLLDRVRGPVEGAGTARAIARPRGLDSRLGVQGFRAGSGLARPAADRSPEQPRRCASDTTASRPRRHVRGNPERRPQEQDHREIRISR